MGPRAEGESPRKVEMQPTAWQSTSMICPSASLQLLGSRKLSSRAQDWLRKATARSPSQGHTGSRALGAAFLVAGRLPGGKLQVMAGPVDVQRK